MGRLTSPRLVSIPPERAPSSGWAKIGFSGNNFFFGRGDQSYGVISDLPGYQYVGTNLRTLSSTATIHGYVNGVEATDLNYGDNAASVNNNGQIQHWREARRGQNLDGNPGQSSILDVFGGRLQHERPVGQLYARAGTDGYLRHWSGRSSGATASTVSKELNRLSLRRRFC